jgi:hypothetical protein
LTSGYIAYGNSGGTGLTGSNALTYDVDNGISVSRITFPSSASLRASANTLDDYEEGTWTPAFYPPLATAASYWIQEGQYTKIGNFVFFRLRLSWSSIEFNNPNDVPWISGLPFASNVTNTYVGVTVDSMYFMPSNTAGNTAFTPWAIVNPYITPGPQIRLGYWYTSNISGYASFESYATAQIPNGGTVTLSGSYLASGN